MRIGVVQAVIFSVVIFISIGSAQNNPITFNRSFGNGGVSTFAYTPDYKEVIVGTNDGVVRRFDNSTGETLLTYSGNWKKPAITMSTSGNLLAIRSNVDSGAVTLLSVYSIKSPTPLKKYKCFTYQRGSVSISGNDSIIMSSDNWGQAEFFLLATDSSWGKQIDCYPKLAPNGKKILCENVNHDGTYSYYDLKGNVCWKRTYKGFDGSSFLPDGSIIIIPLIQSGKGLVIVDTLTGDTIRRVARNYQFSLPNSESVLFYISTLVNDNRIAISTGDSIIVWNTVTDSPTIKLKKSNLADGWLGFSADGTSFYLKNSLTENILIYDVSTSALKGTIPAPANSPFSGACNDPKLSADGTKLLSSISKWDPNQKVYLYYSQLWDVSTGAVLHSFTEHPCIIAPTPSQNGNALLVVPHKDTLHLLDANTGGIITTYNPGIVKDSNYSLKSCEFVRNDSIIYCTFYHDSFNTTSGYEHSTTALWLDRYSGKKLKQLPWKYNEDSPPSIYSSLDGSKYLTVRTMLHYSNYPQICCLYSVSNDSCLGIVNDTCSVAGISPDLSHVIYSNGYQYNLVDSTKTLIIYANQKTNTIQDVVLSNDNSSCFFEYGSIFNSNCTHFLHVKDTLFTIDNGVENYTNSSAFSKDGKKLLVNFTSGVPAIYQISGIASLSPQYAVLQKSSLPRLLSIQGRVIKFSIKNDPVTETHPVLFSVFTLSGRVIASFPLHQKKSKIYETFILPKTLPQGLYAYRMDTFSGSASGFFALK